MTKKILLCLLVLVVSFGILLYSYWGKVESLSFVIRISIGIVLTMVYVAFLSCTWKVFSIHALLSATLSLFGFFFCVEALLSMAYLHQPGFYLVYFLICRSLGIYWDVCEGEKVKVLSRKKRTAPVLVKKVG